MLAERAAPEPMKLTPAIPSSNRRGIVRLMLVLGIIGTLAELTGHPHLHQPRLVLFVFTFMVGLAGVGRVARRVHREPGSSRTEGAARRTVPMWERR